ncbi:putative TrkA-N domain-containing protein [Magnetofaba australis IT-1]|uniref:Putative TrkA-N domain-containing protein n=1 Tax=Magnetofaba australis IT-1 TaxID=1434232 RepID=A0A1Y2K4H8_9PROT|nr:putative TrkA-N domain-containing protein [Magnetofaba australis IT-1]
MARFLSEERVDVTLVESDARAAKLAQEALDAQVIEGEGTDQAVLLDAGLKRAALLLALTDSDETNIVITLIAKARNPDIQVIARVRGPKLSTDRALWSGLELRDVALISPEQSACDMLLQLVLREQAFEVIPFIDGQINLVGFRFDAESPLLGRSLRELGAEWSRNGGALVVAIRRGGKALVPKGDHLFEAGDDVYLALPTTEESGRILRLLGKRPMGRRRIIIAGGGRTGSLIGGALLAKGYRLTIIEQDETRCEQLARLMPSAQILWGRAQDSDLLRELLGSDVTFLALSGNEERNLALALLAKQLGAAMAVTLVDSEAYISLAEQLGVDAIVSPQLAAIGSIMRFVRKGRVIDAAPLLNAQLEAVLAEVHANSALDGVPLRKAKIPRDVLVGAVAQGEEVARIPDGDTVLKPGDRVLLIAPRRGLSRVDNFLTKGAES